MVRNCKTDCLTIGYPYTQEYEVPSRPFMVAAPVVQRVAYAQSFMTLVVEFDRAVAAPPAEKCGEVFATATQLLLGDGSAVRARGRSQLLLQLAGAGNMLTLAVHGLAVHL